MLTLHGQQKHPRNKQERDKSGTPYYFLLRNIDLSIFDTEEERLRILEKVRSGDREAIDKMIFSHVRLAFSIVNRYIGVFNLRYYADDLYSSAMEGVIVAVNRIAKGKMADHDNVTGYIVKHIHGHVTKATNHRSTVYTPLRRKDKITEPITNTLPEKDSQLSIREFEVWDSIDSLASNELEKRILKLRSQNYNDVEVGKILGLSRLQVLRIRHSLLKRYLRKENKW